MGIRFAGGEEGEDALISQINTTPLVDVMLVLLIIFLITIPVVNSSIAVTLPREQNQRASSEQENVIVTVDAQGGTYWFDTRLPDTQALTELLMARSGRVVPKDHIVSTLSSWETDFSENSVEVYIHRLRKRFADLGVTIKTVRGFGYLMELTAEPGAAPAPADG